MTTTITLNPVTRIEGHAKITLECDDSGEVVRGHLHVLELRGFEKLVEGMELSRMPLITGRICGVCPAAHHLASVIAIENGCGITPTEEAAVLRELLYMGHILHSHALSCFVLIGPDLLSGDDRDTRNRSIFNLLTDSPDLAAKALRLRSIGQKIVEKTGGRGIHPVTVIPGGIASRPSAEDMRTIKAWGNEALSLLRELYPVITEKLMALSGLQSVTRLGMKAVALSEKETVSFLSGTAQIIDSSGTVHESFSASNYDEYLQEEMIPGSFMKSVHLKSGEYYFVGALARLMAAPSLSTFEANTLLSTFKSRPDDHWTALDAIEARIIEMVYCAERIGELCDSSEENAPLSIPWTVREGVCRSIVEAPRGLLIHDYSVDSSGHVASANLIVATQNNYHAIDDTITAIARHCRSSDNDLMNGMEFAVRCFDPCLSCATHVAGRMALKIELCRNGVPFRSLIRGEVI
jgi:F420-non-reducing hydrogenase large subunit